MSQTVQMWTVAIDTYGDGVNVGLFATEEEGLDWLLENHDPDEEFTRETIVDELTENQGCVLYIESYTVPVSDLIFSESPAPEPEPEMYDVIIEVTEEVTLEYHVEITQAELDSVMGEDPFNRDRADECYALWERHVANTNALPAEGGVAERNISVRQLTRRPKEKKS